MLFPWQMVCMVHPTGHEHHQEEGELSLCEKRKLCKENSYWPPMDCYRFTIDADDYQLPQNELLIPTVRTLAVAAVLPELVTIELPDEPSFRLPEPWGNSDPPLETNPLRGPPFACLTDMQV